jgi:hypothetical protein
MTLHTHLQQHVDPSGHKVQGVGQLPFACYDRGFESPREHRFLSVVSVVCQAEVSASTRDFLPSVVCLSVIAKRSKEGMPTPGIGSKYHIKKLQHHGADC